MRLVRLGIRRQPEADAMIFIFFLGRFQINISQRNLARMPRRQIEHRRAHDRVIAHFHSMAIFENQGC